MYRALPQSPTAPAPSRREPIEAFVQLSAIALIRYLLFFSLIYLMKNTGDTSVSTSVTVISGGDAPAYISFWYYLSVLKPVLVSVLVAIMSIVGLCRTKK